MKAVNALANSLLALLTGKREHNFYFCSLSTGDCLLGLWFCLLVLLGLRHRGDADARLKQKLVSLYSAEDVLLFGSARSALYFFLRHLQPARGDEVVVTGYTCDVVANAVVQSGFKPVYADIAWDDFSIRSEAVLGAISPRTRVIIIQHTYGIPANSELFKIAKERGLIVIEDCALSLGVEGASGEFTGSLGHVSLLSFEHSKTITCGHGGALIVNEISLCGSLASCYASEVPGATFSRVLQELFQTGVSGLFYRPRVYPIGKWLLFLLFRCRLFRYSSSKEEYNGGLPKDYLYGMSKPQAALLLRQLDRLSSNFDTRQELGDMYQKLIKSYDGMCLYNLTPMRNLIRLPILVGDRVAVKNNLEAVSVEVGLWFTAPLSDWLTDHDLYQYQVGSCPFAELIGNHIINLPLDPQLTVQDVELISDALNQVQLPPLPVELRDFLEQQLAF